MALPFASPSVALPSTAAFGSASFYDCGVAQCAPGTESRLGYVLREKSQACRVATGPQSPLFVLLAVLSIPALVILTGFVWSLVWQ